MRCRSNQHVMVTGMLMHDVMCSLEIKTMLSHMFITTNDVTALDQIQN